MPQTDTKRRLPDGYAEKLLADARSWRPEREAGSDVATLHLPQRIPDGFTDMVRTIGKRVEMLRPGMDPGEFRAIQLMVKGEVQRLLRAFPGGQIE